MTEHSKPQSLNWVWILLGLCGCGIIAVWVGKVTLSPGYSTRSVAEEDGEEQGSETEGDNGSSGAAGAGTSETAGSTDPKTGKSSATSQTDPKNSSVASSGSNKAANSASGPVADGAKPPLGQVTILVPKKVFKKEGPNKAARVGFDDIDIEKVLNTKELTVDLPKAMPDWLQRLHGQRIRLRGYMHPGSAFQAEGIKRFIFCRDTSACCFGPDPTIFYLIDATMKSGTSIEYIEREAFDLEGIFRIEPIVDERSGKMAYFYHLDDAQRIRR